MKSIRTNVLAAAAMAALASGCAATSGGGTGVMAGTEVTRFHLGNNPARGEIAVEPLGADAAGAGFARYAAAVERELTALGWTVVRGNTRSEQVAMVRVEQGTRAALRPRSGVSIGLGGGTGGGGIGVGGGVTVPVGGRGGASQVVVTELVVRLQRRSDGTAIWEGRAQGEARAGTPAADPGMAVDRLAHALFQGFPGESGRTIRVR